MISEKYMARALQLASCGAGHVSPNPMVGAVLADPSGRIIGEGFHRRYGQAHAEVNCMESVRGEDAHLVRESTMYVTLEPCSHYGKTPPCAAMLCRCGVKRVVVGTGDPNPRVAGRGIAMLREAGIEVVENVLQEECLAINERFFTAQTMKRPWILLKWAEDAAGRMCSPDGAPIVISSPVTRALMHAERAKCDAIMCGTGTLLSDNPSLTVRHWPGESPRPVIFYSARIKGLDLKIFERDPIILDPSLPLEQNMHILFEEYSITSLMVEGGRRLLDSFIAASLWDRQRVERAVRDCGAPL